MSIDPCGIEVMKFVFVTGLPATTGRVRQPPMRPRTAQVATPKVTPETILPNIAFLLESRDAWGRWFTTRPLMPDQASFRRSERRADREAPPLVWGEHCREPRRI